MFFFSFQKASTHTILLVRSRIVAVFPPVEVAYQVEVNDPKASVGWFCHMNCALFYWADDEGLEKKVEPTLANIENVEQWTSKGNWGK